MPQSSELAGGAGFTFEDLVAANYLAALLQQRYSPGVENRLVTRVALQQRDFGEPLDDIVVDFRSEAGEPARLSLQVKRSLIIRSARTNTNFRDIIRDSWATLSKPDFRRLVDRYGAAVGEVASDKARDLRTLCELARASATSADFQARFAPGGNVSEAVREVRDDVVALIEETTEAPNRTFIANYFDRYRHGETISTGFVESAINQVVSKRMVKKQQMRWTDCGAHLLLQVRTRVLNEDWRSTLSRWYPGMQETCDAKAA